MHRSRIARRLPAALIAAAAASLGTTACSQATASANSVHTENSVQVTSPTATGHQTQTLRYNTDINSASTPLNLPPAAAWHRVYLAYAKLKIPVTTVDSAHGVIGARNARVRNRLANAPLSSWFDCGMTAVGSPRADSYALFVTIVTQVSPAPGDSSGSTARTIVTANAEANDTQSGAIQCGSKGWLEEELAKAFTAQ